jgi:hypothetical protein
MTHRKCLVFILASAMIVGIGPRASGAQATAVVPVAARNARGGPIPLGAWKVNSFYREDMKTRERRIYFGARPNGYLLITHKWFMACITGDNRSKPAGTTPTNDEKLALYNSLIAYIGPYVLDGNKITIHVKASWNQSWTGTDQVRFISLHGDRMSIRTAPLVDWLDGKLSTYVLTFERAH